MRKMLNILMKKTKKNNKQTFNKKKDFKQMWNHKNKFNNLILLIIVRFNKISPKNSLKNIFLKTQINLILKIIKRIQLLNQILQFHKIQMTLKLILINRHKLNQIFLNNMIIKRNNQKKNLLQLNKLSRTKKSTMNHH